MRKVLHILLVLSLCSSVAQAQVVSFEDIKELSAWKVDNGKIAISSLRYKFGTSSLVINWQPGTRVTFESSMRFMEPSRSRHGGITVWMYDEGSPQADLQIVFYDASDKEVCRMPFRLGYKGWRALWAKFIHDMGKKPGASISKMVLEFPQTSGTLYMDMLDFPSTVSWKYMEDLHYSTSRQDFSMIPDIVRYRNAVPSDEVLDATDEQIRQIEDRFTSWCLGTGKFAKDRWVKARMSAEKDFIKRGLLEAEKIPVEYNDDGTPVGEPLFTLDGTFSVDGKKLKMFRSVNEKILIPLALDYHKNGNRSSLEKIKFIYDWFNDQGWADGSSMGTIVLEKLRSAGYIYSYHLVKDHLPEEILARERAAMNWYTMFGNCYALEERNGANSDDVRSLANGKLIYALSIAEPLERRQALTAFKRYMDKALGIAHGAEDIIKDDYSGYHHRTAYNSGYYPEALYTGAQIAWMLSGTPYALSSESVLNIKNGLKTLHFTCAGLDIPAGTVGRFPKNQKILYKLLPAYAYMILCEDGKDEELIAIFNDIKTQVTKDADWMKYITGVNSDMSYMTTVGEMEAVAEAAASVSAENNTKTGSLFLPYSGMLVCKDKDMHFNVKGYSRYIWDYESGARNENIYGRWMSNGHLEFFDFRNGNRSFNPSDELYDWNHITGTTSKILPLKKLAYNSKSTDHRNYTDQSFLAGVHEADGVSMFSVRLHDMYSDTSFRADKSFFFFEDMVLCLGSGVSSSDRNNVVATTIFQNLSGQGKQKEDAVYEDPSFAYVIKEGNVVFAEEGKRTVAFIDHGTAPHDGGYEYYMLKDKSAAASVLEKSPVEVLRRDAVAHIVSRDRFVCAALFKEGVTFEGMTVESTNVPLAYVLEDKGNGCYNLNLCEPDMRRAWKLNMNDLSLDEVSQEEKAFETTVTISGRFEIVGENPDVKVEMAGDRTRLTLTTVRARNHEIQIKKIN